MVEKSEIDTFLADFEWMFDEEELKIPDGEAECKFFHHNQCWITFDSVCDVIECGYFRKRVCNINSTVCKHKKNAKRPCWIDRNCKGEHWYATQS